MNEMIVGLNERFQLAKFVSGGTMAAIKAADRAGVRLGGERRRATMLFCDIRGYTAFAERHDPETGGRGAQLLLPAPGRHREPSTSGDIDKFVGDQILAVFQGEAMERNAVALRARDPGQDRRARPRASRLATSRSASASTPAR